MRFFKKWLVFRNNPLIIMMILVSHLPIYDKHIMGVFVKLLDSILKPIYIYIYIFFFSRADLIKTDFHCQTHDLILYQSYSSQSTN